MKGAEHGCASPAPRSGTHPHMAQTRDRPFGAPLSAAAPAPPCRSKHMVGLRSETNARIVTGSAPPRCVLDVRFDAGELPALPLFCAAAAVVTQSCCSGAAALVLPLTAATALVLLLADESEDITGYETRRIVQKIGSMAELVPAGASNAGAHFDLRLKTKDSCVHLDFLLRIIRKGGSVPPPVEAQHTEARPLVGWQRV